LAGIEDLICGRVIDDAIHSESDLNGVIKRLRTDVAELNKFLQAPSTFIGQLPASSVIPFFLRKFLELSTTSLLVRIDPMRVIAARKNQSSSSYEEGKLNSSSITWRGDIIAKSAANKEDIWSTTCLEKGIERSLLGWHIGSSAIEPGLKALADAKYLDSHWFNEFTGVDKPFEWIKSELIRLYSTLSKGVHAEYLLDEVVLFDAPSIAQHTNDTYKFICILSAATHFSPLFFRPLEKSEVLEIFLSTEKSILEIKNGPP
jgi:hypothetical protein